MNCGVHGVQCREKKIPLAEIRLLLQTQRKLSEYLNCFTSKEQTVPFPEGACRTERLLHLLHVLNVLCTVTKHRVQAVLAGAF